MRSKTVSIKFGSSPTEQAEAHEIMSIIRDAEVEGDDEPFEQDGKTYHRVLLSGLRWMRTGFGYYQALDGTRIWAIDGSHGPWEASLYRGATVDELVLVGTTKHKRLKDAKRHLEDLARQMRDA